MSAVDWVFRPGVFFLAIAGYYLLIAFLITPKMMETIAAPPRM
jgi:hypothetical protein